MENTFPNKRWLIIPISIVETVNFEQVSEYSAENLRISVDGTKALISYDVNEIPSGFTTSYINAETGDEIEYTIEAGVYGRPSVYSSEYPEYNYEQILEIMNTEEWTKPITE